MLGLFVLLGLFGDEGGVEGEVTCFEAAYCLGAEVYAAGVDCHFGGGDVVEVGGAEEGVVSGDEVVEAFLVGRSSSITSGFLRSGGVIVAANTLDVDGVGLRPDECV